MKENCSSAGSPLCGIGDGKGKRKRALVTFLLFLLCVFVSFAVKTYHYNNAVYDLGKIIRDVPQEKELPFFRKFFPHRHANFAPFTIESGMMFSYAQDIAQGRGVPESDKLLLGQEDLAPYEQMVMGLEWFLGWGYRVKNALFPDPVPEPGEERFQDNPAMAWWMSLQIRLWASLVSGLLFLWLTVLKCPRPLALMGGLLHAVALASVARATGQDLVRGEFCMPFLIAALVLAHAVYLRPNRWKEVGLFLCTFAAVSTWDLCQMFFSLWGIFELFRYLLGGKVTAARRNAWILIAAAVVLSALIIPFNRTYSLIMSPLALVILPTLISVLLFGGGRACCSSFNGAGESKRGGEAQWKERRFPERLIRVLLVSAVLYGVWYFFVNTPEYASNYSHFSELLRAKIRFGNVKPPDPDLLTYDARIMWTPSMHSATWMEVISYFPSLYFGLTMKFTLFRLLFGLLPVTLTFFYFLLFLGTVFSLPRAAFLRGAARSLLPVLFTVLFTVGFVYIVRYHEFLIIFLCTALPLLIQDYLHAFRYRAPREGEEPYLRLRARPRLMKGVRVFLVVCCIFCLGVEVFASLFAVKRRYTGDVQLKETATLIEWFRRSENTRGKGVMANLTIGPMMKAYCGSAIALNPQFGLERIRRPTEIFLNTVFHGTEQQLAEFCNRLHAEYFIYNKGSLGSMGPYSNRYIAAAKEIPGDSPANMMYYHSNKLLWFYRIDPPPDLRSLSRVYSVFRVIRPEDRIGSIKVLIAGENAWNSGDETFARRCAAQAVRMDPVSDSARTFFFRVYGRLPKITLDGVE